ncbi:MAG: site-2 protease family protein [Isosphaeraceae bacterium]
MSWSWKIGRIAGIPIYIHWTFLILIAWIVYGQTMAGHDLAAIVEAVVFVLALFGCVVLHELGHALAARRYGVPTSDITLLPIGGVARLQRIPEKPAEELVVALAGPAVTLVIAFVLLAVGVRLPVDPENPQALIQMGFFPKLLLVNIFILLFNLLPAFPMDGGRVLRALLAMRLEYARATRIAAWIGQFMAVLFGFLGLASGNPVLLLIALFVWIGAGAEATQVEERMMLRGARVRDAMLTDYQTLDPSDTLSQAADLLLAGSQPDFPVLSDGRPAGLLTRGALLNGLSKAGGSARVADFLHPELGVVEADSMLVPAVARLRESEGHCLQVVDRGEPVGLLTLENIGELLMVRSALSSRTAHAQVRVLDRSTV